MTCRLFIGSHLKNTLKMRKTRIHMRISRIFAADRIRRKRYCQGANKHRNDYIFVYINVIHRVCYA